jgi:hypothetical protein
VVLWGDDTNLAEKFDRVNTTFAEVHFSTAKSQRSLSHQRARCQAEMVRWNDGGNSPKYHPVL